MRSFAALLCSLAAAFAGGPENVLLVVNADSWASTWIANEYAAARGIPPGNIVLLRDVADFERVSVADFREKILGPALLAAERRGLAPQLDYVLYSADFPWAVDVSADMAGRTFPKNITQPAAINGLTFLYQHALAKRPDYLGMNANFYYRQISRVAPEPAPWPEDEQRRYAEALNILQEISASREKNRAEREKIGAPPDAAEQTRLAGARDAMLALRAAHPKTTELLYNLACVHAQLGEGDAAIAVLGYAMENGWWDMRHAENDPDLRSLHTRADFKALAARAKEAKFELVPTSGFRGNVGWHPSGAPVLPQQGNRYLLSTMLAVTSGRGTSAREAVEGLRRSIAADGTRPKGTIYYMENRDVRSNTREWGFARAVEKLRELGVNAIVETGVLPKGKEDVAGACIGIADFDWAKSGSRITPGAIVEHLTSFGGVMSEGAGQTPLSAFIAAGAAGASGTVTEPYAIQQKFPSPFIHWHYAQGCTLAEAFYQSVAAPYQLLIVGDALCAPWKKAVAVSADGLARDATLSGTIKVTPRIESPGGLSAGLFELHFNGRRVAVAKPGEVLEFDTTRAPDGAHEIQLIGTASDAVVTGARVTLPVTIRNGAAEISASANASGDWPWDRPVELTARASSASAIPFFHNGREVARIAGGEGSVTLDPRILGQGPARIQAVAVAADGKEIAAPYISFRVVPPAPLPAAEPPARLANGLSVIPAGAGASVAARAEGDWLAKAGVQKGGDFAVEAWFRVDLDDVYQFQLRGPEKIRLFVDGEPQTWPRGKSWWFAPVNLAKGAHKLRIEATDAGALKMDVRFGGPGSIKLEGARFQHAE
jgi:hypothetical protein